MTKCKPDGSWEEFGSNLLTCMKLRGVSLCPHRTLHEFDWFVDQCIFRRADPDEGFDAEKYYDLYIKEAITLGPEKDLIGWSRAFLQYCIVEYDSPIPDDKIVLTRSKKP